MNANNNQQAPGQQVPVHGSACFTPVNAELVPGKRAIRKQAAKPTKKVTHYCGIGACRFKTQTAKGVKEHQKNKHLGLVCLWFFPATNEFCTFKADTHEEVYTHFTKEHAKKEAQMIGDSYVCCWPGMPRREFANGSIPPENKCEQKFKQASGAERHCREHQHKAWLASLKAQ